MNGINLGGIGNISGGQYDSIKVEGISSCSNNIKAEDICVEGVFTCSGEVEAGFLHCKGVSDFKANIRAKRILVEGVLTEKDGTKIEAEEIDCEGVIKTGGEISADNLKAKGVINAKEIYGDHILINTHYAFNKIRRFFRGERSDIKLIEATTIELSGVTADTVNGKDIVIGPDCRINSVDCSGTLSIDSSSSVGKITGEYTRKDR
jgi:ribosomal protein L24